MTSNSPSTNAFHYRDFGNVQEGDASLPVVPTPRSARQLQDKEQAFPVKLHYVLNEMEKDGLQHIASWQVHGRCFVIHNPSLFEKEILAFWFRQSKFASFTRQLNIYGFTRIASGQDKGGYYHELFLRGKSFLAERILRVKVKGTGPRKPDSCINRPDFTAFPPVAFARPASAASASPPRLCSFSSAPLLQGSSNATAIHKGQVSLSSSSRTENFPPTVTSASAPNLGLRTTAHTAAMTSLVQLGQANHYRGNATMEIADLAVSAPTTMLTNQLLMLQSLWLSSILQQPNEKKK